MKQRALLLAAHHTTHIEVVGKAEAL